MAKDPAILFYTSDFLSGTITMSNEQVGMYIRLLCIQHQKQELSEKDMLNICKSYDEDIFSKFTKTPSGKYFNERMRDVIEKRTKYSESRAANRKKTKSNPEHMLNTSKTYVNHMENGNGIVNEEEIKKGVKIHFNVFWDSYGKRLGNLFKLEQYWQGLPESEQKAILKFIPEYKKFQPDARFRLNPEKFFEDQFWKGELPKQEKEKPKTRWNRLPQ